ncbi:uL13 family ribosomal protein [Kocuria rhizophila]|nr:uL13 family ribosomal protein [Kocuria rhizophila]
MPARPQTPPAWEHKPTFVPTWHTGEISSSSSTRRRWPTGSKLQKKGDHPGYPADQSTSYAELLENNRRGAVEKAVKGMLPKNKLAAQQLSKLKVYAGAEHPHQAQQPKPYEFTQVAQ